MKEQKSMFCQGFTLAIYPIEIDGTAEVPNGTNHLKYLLTHDIPFQKAIRYAFLWSYDLLVNLINDLTIKRTEDKSGSLPQKYAQALR